MRTTKTGIGLGTLALAGALAGCGGGGDAPPAGTPAVCAVAATTTPSGALFTPADPPAPLAQVSGPSPFAFNCGQEVVCGTVYLNAEVEPWVARNPVDGDNLVGTWQQDRWSNGGAQGLLAAFSNDGGASWTRRQVPFSRCSGGNSVNGGDYARATDPWVSFGADGRVFWMAMTITDLASGGEVSAMRVSRSLDGGATWNAPVTLIHDTLPFFNDKNSLTADPTDARYAYAVWDRLNYGANSGPAYYSRTTNGGDSWSTARVLYDPGPEAQTIGNQVAVLSDGTAVNLFTEIQYGTSTTPDSATLRIVRSTDRGATWGAPVTISEIHPYGAHDPETGAPVRDGSILGSIAVGPDDRIWVAWQESTLERVCITAPCIGPEDRIALVVSADGGLTWSLPGRVNGDTSVQAFTPAVHVAPDGTVGVAYYDFRDNTSDPATLLTSLWLATSTDGTTWTEELVSGPFDQSIAPNALGLFLGDYLGLTSHGNAFRPFFAQTTASLADRTVINVTAPGGVTAGARKLRRSYEVVPQPKATPDAAWADAVGANIRRQRAQPPDVTRPGSVPKYLRGE